VSRLPIRLRLTLSFAVGMAVVLAAAGLFIYVRVGGALLSSVDQRLRVQAQEVSGRVEKGRSLFDRDTADGPTVAQLVNGRGVVAQSMPRSLRPIVEGATLRRARAGGTVWRSGSIAGLANDWRILTVPARVGGGAGALVVAQSLEPREEALQRLVREFMLGGAAALLLAILAGYAVAVAALRPVEAMRRRAAAIGAATPEKRLPVPPSRDELSRLAETLNDMLGRLQAALEHERRFVDDASHELRTPLALLKTELEIALRQPRSREELEEALGSAADETDRLTRLAEDLLLVARADDGQLPIRVERVSARRLLADVAARFEVRAGEHGRSIAIADGPDAAIDADLMRLEQALGNLVDNALLHGDGVVVLSARADGETVELHVTDEGSGFPVGFVDRAFDRFSRADEARGRGGTGLGLAIVELIARAHGGSAAVSTRPDGGADAWIALPSSPRSPEPSQPAALSANS
jgi:two-component system, OmpR family, sensor kinase